MTAPTPVFAEPAEVAVIIPAFNSGDYLDQALASVAGQTFRPSGVVVADDCSSDDTSDRARRWAGCLPLNVVRLDRNRGPGVARNCAIRASNAPLLAMLDADDLFLPDHIETMVRTHTASPGLVSAQELSWYPGVGLKLPRQPRNPPGGADQVAALLRRNFVNFGFFSRELYELTGGFGDQYYCEDWDLWIRMVRTGANLAIASHPTAVHRVHAQSLSFDAARIAQHGVSYLTTAIQAAKSPAEAAAARSGIQALKAKLSFYRAMELAGQGEGRQARRVALDAFPAGGLRASAGLLATAMAPALAARLERATRRNRIPAGGYVPASEAAAGPSKIT
jgi:GT2 family glycosyltransferase